MRGPHGRHGPPGSMPSEVDTDSYFASMQAADALHSASLAVLKALAFSFNVPTYTIINALLDDEVLQPGQRPSSLLRVIQYKQRSDAAAALAAAEEDAHEDRGVLSVVTSDQPGLQVGSGAALAGLDYCQHHAPA